jgi:hypothetical protein
LDLVTFISLHGISIGATVAFGSLSSLVRERSRSFTLIALR